MENKCKNCGYSEKVHIERDLKGLRSFKICPKFEPKDVIKELCRNCHKVKILIKRDFDGVLICKRCSKNMSLKEFIGVKEEK